MPTSRKAIVAEFNAAIEAGRKVLVIYNDGEPHAVNVCPVGIDKQQLKVRSSGKAFTIPLATVSSVMMLRTRFNRKPSKDYDDPKKKVVNTRRFQRKAIAELASRAAKAGSLTRRLRLRHT